MPRFLVDTETLLLEPGGEQNRKCEWAKTKFSKRKNNENGLKTLSFNDKDKIKGKVNSTRIDFLV